MDQQRFDDMVRTLSERNSRRGALRLLTGGIFGALVGVPTVGALAKPKKKKKKKSNCAKKSCPQGYQRNKRTCKCVCTRVQCTGGKEFDVEACRCACPRGLRECRDGCVGPDRCCPGDPPCPEDPKGCCHAPGLDVCTIDGCCRELDGMKACNDFCVDTDTHPSHCGDCNVVCEPGETCVRGECTSEEQGEGCPNGQPRCGGECCEGNEMCGVDKVCENPFVCPRAYCSNRNLVCCPPNSFTDTAYCCPTGAFCRDTFIGCSAI
jgi:hypothetical protein